MHSEHASPTFCDQVVSPQRLLGSAEFFGAWATGTRIGPVAFAGKHVQSAPPGDADESPMDGSHDPSHGEEHVRYFLGSWTLPLHAWPQDLSADAQESP